MFLPCLRPLRPAAVVTAAVVAASILTLLPVPPASGQTASAAAGVPATTPAPAPMSLETGFLNPPTDTKPYCYWYWISDNVSKEGITRDLESMAQVGIGEAYIGNVDVNPRETGPVKVLSEEWWGLVEHAIREGKRLGVNIGVFNCPGWSQSGGPWVSATQTMRYIVSSETRVHGPMRFDGKLPAPDPLFQDVATLAFPAPALDSDNLAAHGARVHSTPAVKEIGALFDGKLDTACPLMPAGLAKGQPLIIDAETDQPCTVRSFEIHSSNRPLTVTCELQAADASGAISTPSAPSPSTGTGRTKTSAPCISGRWRFPSRQ